MVHRTEHPSHMATFGPSFSGGGSAPAPSASERAAVNNRHPERLGFAVDIHKHDGRGGFRADESRRLQLPDGLAVYVDVVDAGITHACLLTAEGIVVETWKATA